ncbi:MAG: radical SAM protein [Magnetococcales bacterium]|nr:radical SAM protein [Magnetococcales bacterium]
MQSFSEKLIVEVSGRPLLVWGARMTGMGFLRFARRHRFEVLGFIDSDPSLCGRKVNGIPVYPPAEISVLRASNPALKIVVAVALKEDEIVSSLREMGCDASDWTLFTRYVENYYTIDIVGTCNLKCLSCAYVMDYDNVKGVMLLDDFRQVLAKILGEVDIVSHVSLYSWGEPLLHPDLDVIIGLLHDAGIAVAVSSNLSFKNERPILKMVRAAPEYLKISVSGFEPEVYDVTHSGGDIELVKANLVKLRRWMDEFGTETFVDVNYHLYRNNNGTNLKNMGDFCRNLGFNFSTSYALVMPLERVLAYCDGNPDPKTLALHDLLLVGIDEGREASKEFRNQPCRYLTNQVNIDWDRSVALCCVCFEKPNSIIADDYLTIGLEELNARKLRHPMCAKCYFYGLPAYNLGFNQKEWQRIASLKPSTDRHGG